MGEGNFGYMTVGDIRRAIEGKSDAEPVYYHRIEDEYFEKHGWTTLDLDDYEGYPYKYIRAFGSVGYKPEKALGLFITAHY